MKKKAVFLIVFTLLFLTGKQAFSGDDKRFFFSGFYEFLSDFPAGVQNPNNRGLIDGDNDLNVLRQKIHLDMEYLPSKNLAFKGQFRFFHNATDDVGRNISNFDAFPRDFNGNGTLLRTGGDDAMFEVRELYGELTIGDWWLRLGKQQIAWGESLGMRILDQVNPLDLSDHFLNYRIWDEFKDTRIPQWSIRVVRKFPNFNLIPDLAAEFICNPGDIVPTILPAQGSPLNPVPAFVTINEDIPRGDPVLGGRIEGTIKDVYLTLNVLSKPVDDPVLKSMGAVVDPQVGLPVEVAPGFYLPLRFINKGEHPRTIMAGGSFSYNQRELGLIWHGEFVYHFDSPFRAPNPNPSLPDLPNEDREVTDAFLGVDKKFYIFPVEDPLLVGLQFRQTHIRGGNTRNILNSAGAAPPQDQEIFSIFLQQPLHNKDIYPEVFFMYDRDDAYWLQAGVHYKSGDHWRFDLYYNKFGGAEDDPGRLGALTWDESVFFKVTYGFSL